MISSKHRLLQKMWMFPLFMDFFLVSDLNYYYIKYFKMNLDPHSTKPKNVFRHAPKKS